MVLRERRQILDAHKGGEQPKDIMTILHKALDILNCWFELFDEI